MVWSLVRCAELFARDAPFTHSYVHLQPAPVCWSTLCFWWWSFLVRLVVAEHTQGVIIMYVVVVSSHKIAGHHLDV